MSTTVYKQLPDAEQVSRTAATEFVQLAAQAVSDHGVFRVALSGGNTPRRLYQVLSEMPFRLQVEWHKIEFFWGDERGVPADHPDSNFHMACEALLRKVPVPDTHIHHMQADRSDRDAAAADYQREIARIFQVRPDGEPPVFDLVLLGMGPDAHTASLFPHTAALRESQRWVVSNYVAKFTAFRMTMTPAIINQAASIVFVVTGAEKASILAEVLEGPQDQARLPSQLIRPVSGKLTWFLDRIAASRLTSTPLEVVGAGADHK
jgi:6-phosphogluconolactonase